jgi:hypothetical protein
MSNFEVCAYLPYICVRLKLYSRNTPCIPACPVGLADGNGVVKIFVFPRSKSGIFDLNLKKLSHFWTDAI